MLIYTNKPDLLESYSGLTPTFHIQDVDVKGCVIFGGDGTIIRFLKYSLEQRKNKLPVFTFNTGHLGFLSSNIQSISDIRSIISSSFCEKFHSPIYPLKIELIDIRGNITDTRIAINDLVIQPKHRGRLFCTNVTLNGNSITYEGDGLVISSTTGSTAYNLSIGGPILTPDMKAVIINPIAPFSMSSRPLVVSDHYNISIRVIEEPYIAFDGQEYESKNTITEIRVTIQDDIFNLIRKNKFVGVIQEKLHWNKNIKGM